MKKAFRVLVPLLMSIVILISIGWYFLKYDPDLTRDILLDQARYLDEIGNHSGAVWFYNLAYRQSEQDDGVAIELAEQYKSIGNFTKAEYTLSNAIADGGSAELYIALCQTYVEQNKLIDAVTMLNNIGDPNMKAQLDALRPAAPEPSLAAGSYSQYITLDLNAKHGTVYMTTDQEYPSLETDAYEGPVSLPAGETVIYALTVDDNGLVSPLAVYSYLIVGVVEEIHFVSQDFEAALKAQLGFAEDRTVYSNELWDVQSFSMPASVTDYTDLKWLPNLKELEIRNGSFNSLLDIAQLNKLHTLIITDSIVGAADLAAIAVLPELTELTLSNCQISSITNLSGATSLEYLDLGGNAIRDLDVLSGLTQLKALCLDHNAVISLEAIAGLTSLQILDVSYNSLVSTLPVSTLHNLTYLDVSGNGLMVLEGLENLTSLTHLYAAYNNLTDVSILGNCTRLVELNVSNNTLLNIDVVSQMPRLEELNFSYNEVASLPQFSANSALWAVSGDYNQLSSLEALSGLRNLAYVYMDYNENIRSVDPLANCYSLLVVSLYGTKVSDVSALSEMSVVIHYDPTA